MIIALFATIKKEATKKIILEIKDFLIKNNTHVVMEDDKAKEFGCELLSSVAPKDINFLLSLGGDGTILRIMHENPLLDTPVIGVNLGTLGFMAAISSKNIFEGLKSILGESYKIENRLMLEGKTSNSDTCFAVNEMVVHRAQNSHLIELSISADDIYINTFYADGVIIATPSGSTAYSLAAGGPILTTDLDAFALTPISPHTISNRPIVINSNKELKIKYLTKNNPVEVSFDGISRFNMHHGETFTIKRAKRIFRLVHLPNQDYFSTLRCKLGWSGKLK